mgnify:CR=1 FL=1
MKVVFHEDFYQVYTGDPAAASGRMEAIVQAALQDCRADLIGISAGFDNHAEDWGGLLKTRDYETIGHMVRSTADRNGGGCFGILEGGYNHSVLGENVLALIQGMGG